MSLIHSLLGDLNSRTVVREFKNTKSRPYTRKTKVVTQL